MPSPTAHRRARFARAICAMVIVLGCADANAAAGAVSTLDASGVSVAAYGGWAAWSRTDPATHAWALVVRSPQGAISLAPVAEAGAPFDVELGPQGSGVAAVYSRCRNSGVRSGCRLAMLALGVSGASEMTLAPPGGGSDHEPAIWRGSVVFARRNTAGGSESSTHPGRRPDGLYSWSIGARKVVALALPASRGVRNSAAGDWPGGRTGLISGLTYNGKQLAYVTTNTSGTFGESTLWFEPLGGHAELIDQVTGGAGNVCPPAFLSPVLSGQWLYAYLHACDPSANARLDRLTRYRHGQVQRARYTFLHTGDEELTAVVPDGPGVYWDAAGIERLAGVSWQTIPAPVAQTFCNRSDPFC